MGKLLDIEEYQFKFDKAMDVMFFARTGSVRPISQIYPRRSALDGSLKVIQKKKSLRIRRQKENAKVLSSLGITPGKKNQKPLPGGHTD